MVANAEIAELIEDYRRASARLRRQNATTFAMAANVRTLDTHSGNNSIRTSVCQRLRQLGRSDIGAALDDVHQLLIQIAIAQDEGRDKRLAELREEIKKPRRVIREALRS